MSKYWVSCAIVVVTVSVAVKELGCDAADEGSVNLAEAYLYHQKMQQRVTTYRLFRQSLYATLDYLARGDIGLREAAVRVHGAAEEYAPQYLDMVKHVDQGRTIQESIARNLVGHLQV